MIPNFIINIFRFFILIFIQLALIDYLFGSIDYLRPFVYILFILMLPFATPKWLLLVLSFSIGLVLDFFNDSYGLHSTAGIILGFARPFVLKFIAPHYGYETKEYPSISKMGLIWFLKYTFYMIVIHHFIFFTTEAVISNNFDIIKFALNFSITIITSLILILFLHKLTSKKYIKKI